MSQEVTNSLRKRVSARRGLHENRSHNVTYNQNSSKEATNPTKQTPEIGDESEENGNNESDKESVNSSMQEDSISNSTSEHPEESDSEKVTPTENPEKQEPKTGIELRNGKRIPESIKLKPNQDLDQKVNSDKPKVDPSLKDFKEIVSVVYTKYFWLMMILIMIVLLIVAYFIMSGNCVMSENSTVSKEETPNFNRIKKLFPTQDEELWNAFEAGVEDVVHRKRPSTFIFLYKEDEETVNNILSELSKYASCRITACNKMAIELRHTELNSVDVVRDYGTIIERYQDKLEERGVMVIKNLEKIPGKSAQVFHAFCDEFTPLVEKSIILFTMKVDQLPKDSDRMKFTEDYLKDKWSDINVDTLNALITRITSMVLEIRT